MVSSQAALCGHANGIIQLDVCLQWQEADVALSTELRNGSLWGNIFPEGMPRMILSLQTMEVLERHGLVSRGASTSLSPDIHIESCGGKLSLQSWIFVSSYGRHGQPLDNHDQPTRPQMLIDWTEAMPGLPQAPAASYVRIIVVRSDEAEVEVVWDPHSFTTSFTFISWRLTRSHSCSCK